jgi:hypothetical protein
MRFKMLREAILGKVLCGSAISFSVLVNLSAATNVYLLDVPDYAWWGGCFGTGCGNLMGYWDRNGFADFYTGPTAGGVAPMDSFGPNRGIQSLWTSRAGFDGRPADQPGHIDDYWAYYVDDSNSSYESTEPDPYTKAGRAEHAPDCIGDFIGLSQDKWTSLNGECDGNIDAFSFTYWDSSGAKRVNYQPGPEAGIPATDIPSGLRAWANYRGYSADVYSQLVDFNPSVPPGSGFTFDDLRREIDAGYPVLLFLQRPDEMYRFINGRRVNPHIHGMLAYGYFVTDAGQQFVRYRTSWASGDNVLSAWVSGNWQADLPVRGVMGFHPLPQIKNVSRASGNLTINWHGPTSRLYDANTGEAKRLYSFVLEKAASLKPSDFAPVGPVTTELSMTIPDCCDASTFFRVRLVEL